MNNQAPHIVGYLFVLFVALGITVLCILPYWRIFSKAGFPGALSLLMLIPLVNIVMLYVLAFSRWKTLPSDNPTYLPPNDTLLR